jgi:hypothetical protein
MVIQRGLFSLELVEAYRRYKCPEQVESGSGEAYAQVIPDSDYFVRLSVVDGEKGDPSRKFLFYVNVNDLYIGHRQVLSQSDSFVDVGLFAFNDFGTLIGTNQPMRFQEARLLGMGDTKFHLINSCPMNNDNDNDPSMLFHTNLLHMGKITVKVYEGVLDRRASAFGNNASGDEAYQPGLYVDTITLHCATTPELGITYLTMPDRERLRKALMKRPAEFWEENTPTTAGQQRDQHRPSLKRMRTENGFVAVMQQAKSAPGSGMDCEMVMQSHPWPLA